jgi:hypothetical protein
LSSHSKATRFIQLGTVASIALFVLALSWPRLQASVRYLPVDIAINRYFQDRQIPSDRLEVLIRFASEAIAYHDHYRYHDGLSLLHYLRGLDINTPALQRRDAYRTAEAEAVTTLQHDPAQPSSWMRLANIRWILHDEPENIIGPWKMSIFTGRMDSTLISQRAGTGLAHRQAMDHEAEAMLRDQLLLAWRLQPSTFIKVLSRRDPTLSLTRELVQNTDPAALEEMEAWLEKLR